MAATSLANNPAPLLGGSTVKQADLPQEIQEILRKPLPSEAIGKHPRIQGLSSIKAAFVIERLNEAFGVGGWDDTVEVIDRSTREETWCAGSTKEKRVTLHIATVHLTFFVEKYGIHKENFGGCDNVDLGDALKGARTDALTKIASELGVGLDVYKSGRENSAKEQMPTCPRCGKTVRRNKEGIGYFCWKAKGGCGGNFSDDGLRSAQEGRTQALQRPQRAEMEPKTTASHRSDTNGKGSGFARQFALACQKGGKSDAEAATYLQSLGFEDPTGVPPQRYNELMRWAQAS